MSTGCMVELFTKIKYKQEESLKERKKNKFAIT